MFGGKIARKPLPLGVKATALLPSSSGLCRPALASHFGSSLCAVGSSAVHAPGRIVRAQSYHVSSSKIRQCCGHGSRRNNGRKERECAFICRDGLVQVAEAQREGEAFTTPRLGKFRSVPTAIGERWRDSPNGTSRLFPSLSPLALPHANQLVSPKRGQEARPLRRRPSAFWKEKM